MLIVSIAFVVLLIIFIYKFNKMTDAWFIIIACGFTIILVQLLPKVEHFEDILVSERLAKLFSIPNKVSGVLVPKFDYVIESVKGGSTSNNGGHDEEVLIESGPYVQARDTYVVDEETNMVNEDKLLKMKKEYKAIDDLLRQLRIIDKSTYEKLLEGYISEEYTEAADMTRDEIESIPS